MIFILNFPYLFHAVNDGVEVSEYIHQYDPVFFKFFNQPARVQDFFKGVPVELSVVATWLATCPAFPIPLAIILPPD